MTLIFVPGRLLKNKLKKGIDFLEIIWYNNITKRGENKMDKRINKMNSETLQQFLAFRKRAGKVPSKKGKGSYDRKSFKRGE